MKDERNYTKITAPEHIKRFGQYFTDDAVADFMCAWACPAAKSMLDPAAGNSIFLRYAKKHNPSCALTGYEIDGQILRYFGNPSAADLRQEDYLFHGWDSKYDAIVCNPPYHKFQAVHNRKEILDAIYAHTGIRYSGYTNLYILFLIKSIFQLSDAGRLAYIIPSEFMNSKYGAPVKQLLVEQRLLRAIIRFQNDSGMFFNATTTCCILLLDRAPKDCAALYSLSSVDGLNLGLLADGGSAAKLVPYGQLGAGEKWLSFFRQGPPAQYANLRPVSDFCSVSRGIATGANSFFCFSASKARRFGIPERCLSRCICRSADIRGPVLDAAGFEALAASDKTVYVLDAAAQDYAYIRPYIEYGEREGIHKKYLPACRSPWYSMEQKPAAPIWVSSASRKGMKFVRNRAMAKSLTTFHSIFVHEPYREDTDLIFCYFLTPIGQAIIRENRKELGNSLDKFQPNDLNTAQMLDIRLITPQDRARVSGICRRLGDRADTAAVAQLNDIFAPYLRRDTGAVP